jgi:integrase
MGAGPGCVERLKGLTFHDLRHEVTSRLFKKGLNPMEVVAITGHKWVTSTKYSERCVATSAPRKPRGAR